MSDMVGDVGTPTKDIMSSNDEDLKKLEDDFKNLQDQTQDLINERAHMEAEIRSLKKRANRLDDEVRSLKSPPLIVGHLEDILDQEWDSNLNFNFNFNCNLNSISISIWFCF